jgi:hypothetical protein
MRRPLLTAAVLSCLPAFAASFQPLPPEPGGKPTGLEVRVVSYNGSTNGAITVEVRNPTSTAQVFSAAGLFFVPAMDPDQAPQRLGAVGPYEVKAQRHEKLELPANSAIKANLDVYCIDSHRSSPTSQTPFRIAKERLPPQLTAAIDTESKQVAAPMGGVSTPAAKSAVQSTVWKNRDAKWIRVEGESKQEANK